jgi:hypothetical protein
MAFGITSVKVYPLEHEDSMRRACIHAVEVELTAANTDTSLDLASLAASDADAEYLETLLNRADKVLSYGFVGSDPQPAQGGITKLDSAASAGGDNTETYTVTGLLTTDVVLGVSIFEKGAGTAANLPIIDYGSATGTVAVADALPVEHVGDPGAGCKVRVTVQRVATPVYGTNHKWNQSATAPVFTFAGGGTTPTTLKLFMLVKLKKDMNYVKSNNL